MNDGMHPSMPLIPEMCTQVLQRQRPESCSPPEGLPSALRSRQGTARDTITLGRGNILCCPATADLHLGKEVDQQPSATKQTHPPLNLEANSTDTVANQLPADRVRWKIMRAEDMHTRIYSATTTTVLAPAPKTRQKQEVLQTQR